MHRFFIPPEQCQAPQLLLTGREAHHAVHVLRLAVGEAVVVLDGAGSELRCQVEEARRDRVSLRVQERRQIPPWPCQITLLQAIPKGRILEDIIHKATELGVRRLVPLLAERVVIHLDAEGIEAKTSRWRQTAVEAIKQCGSAWLPQIDAPLTPAAFVARRETFDLSLIGSLQEDRRHPRECFQSCLREHGHLPRSLCVWVGPEGDFTPAEVALARSAGAWPISLGRLVLRCETAALYCLSILNYELQ
jgi:16S rRNA (uracil1498-N3)-methyltransferase